MDKNYIFRAIKETKETRHDLHDRISLIGAINHPLDYHTPTSN